MEKEKVICLDDEDGEDILSEEDDIEEENDDDEEEEDIEALGENGEKKVQQRKKGEENGNKFAEQVKIGEENLKSGQDSTKPKFKKPQKRSNKISLEELAKQISQNQSKRVGGGDKDVKGTFDWIQYSSEDDRTLNYVNDFVESNKTNVLDYMRLDLSELESVEKVNHHHSQVSSITDDLYKRILRYGQVESISSIAKKSGALKKGESTANNFRDELFYDQNDPFIDDDEYTNQAKGSYQQRMQLAEVFLDDFRSFYGDLPEFVNSEIYTHRVQIMHNLESKNTQQEQTQQEAAKKKKKQASLVNSNINNNTNTSKTSSNSLSLTAAVTATAKAIPITISSDKKSVADLEKELAGSSSFSEPFKTHEKKKHKKDSINNANNLPKPAQVNLLSANMNNPQIPAAQSLPQVQQDSVAQAIQNLNKTVNSNNNNTTTAASAAALSQLLQQQQQQQQQQSQHSSLLQNLQLENYQKNQSNQLSQYYMPYQGMILPNYYDTSAAAQSLFLNSNMMLQYTQPNNLSATNFIYQSAAPTTSKAPTYQLNPSTDLHINQIDINKEKKKKKKQTTSIKDPLNLDKKQGKRDFIEIEDDDDLAKQKTQTS